MIEKKIINENIQISKLIKIVEQSEPCLFHNSKNNLMPIKYENISLEKIKLLLHE